MSRRLYYFLWKRQWKSSIRDRIFCTPEKSISSQKSKSLLVTVCHMMCWEVAGVILLFWMPMYQLWVKVWFKGQFWWGTRTCFWSLSSVPHV